MKRSTCQTFLSLYPDQGRIEYSVGSAREMTSSEQWLRETKRLGQVPTPPDIAVLMARWVMSAKPEIVLDPAAGLGNLLHACADLREGVKMVAVERDEDTFQQAKRTAPHGTKLILADYLFAESGQFTGIIANPPYVKSQRLEYSEAEWRYFDERFGVQLDRLTNLYAIFLLKIWDDLAPGGRAAVLLPAEFMNANFGEEIKERLLNEMHPAGVVVFAPELNLFPDALTTSSIIFLERGGTMNRAIKAMKVSSLEAAVDFVGELLGGSVAVSAPAIHDLRTFDPREKWLNALLESEPSKDVHLLTRTIGEYFQCRRGIATGANNFFCLNESLLHEHRLSQEHIEPCVTKATDADGIVFSRQKFAQLAALDRRCYLLSPRANGSSELDSYLRVGQELGIHERHLPSHRPVWYQPENRAVADVWVAVFSRETVKFILNTSGAKNLTCFHGLYARNGHNSLAPLLVLFLNSSWGRIAFSQVNRFYGDGLNKLEPKDVEAMPCPTLPAQTTEQAKQLTARLIELESVPDDERRQIMDRMVAELLALPVINAAEPKKRAEAPAGPLPRPAKNLRRAAPRKRRAAPVQ
ncbi:MAG: N-6 DNA methylase [Verrucomicrobiales bacterium]|nr:N-6 DNA methylase [Verrucomicrobiales bacterium]